MAQNTVPVLCRHCEYIDALNNNNINNNNISSIQKTPLAKDMKHINEIKLDYNNIQSSTITTQLSRFINL
jgi:hypothetical protein